MATCHSPETGIVRNSYRCGHALIVSAGQVKSIDPRRLWWSPVSYGRLRHRDKVSLLSFSVTHHTLFKPLTVERTAELGFEAASNKLAPKDRVGAMRLASSVVSTFGTTALSAVGRK